MSKNLYYAPDAMWDTWSEILKSLYYGDLEPTFECETLVNAKMYYEAFCYFFEVGDYNPTFKQTNDIRGKILNYMDKTVEGGTEFSRTLLKPFPEKEQDLCYSFAPFDVCNKGIGRESKMILECNLDGIDLGNSRNFKNTEEIIYKVNILRKSSMYLGTKCSWSRIAMLFDLIVVKLAETNPNFTDYD